MAQQEMSEDRLTATAVDLAARIAVLGLVVAWCYVLFRPFVAIVLWGIILAIALYPVFLKLKGWLFGRGSLSAIVLTLVGLVILLGPVSVMSASFVDNLTTFAGHLSAGTLKVPPPPAGVADWPIIGESVRDVWSLASVNLEGALTKYSTQVAAVAAVLLQLAADAGLTLVQFILAIIIAGILMPNADRMSHGLTLFAARLTPSRGAAFIELARSTVRNVARGVIGVSVLQTLLIAFGFVAAGVPLAGLLALLCLILAIIQIGPGIIVIGSIVYVWSVMDTLTAVLFTVWMVPAMLIDNILRPIVMARGLPVPMVVILIGVLGGTIVHGLIGLFIGPVVLSFGYELVRAWVLKPTDDDREPAEAKGETP